MIFRRRKALPGGLLAPFTLGVLALACLPARAQEAEPPAADETATVEPVPTITPPAEEAERPWRFGLALGYGKRSNPLIQSDDIPVIVDVDIAWFGKRWFFDNGDLGFALLDQPAFTTNLVARLNSDRVFFGKTDTRYVNFTYLSNGAVAPLRDAITGTVIDASVPVRPPDRDYAIEAGLETLFSGDWGSSTVRAFRDVSGTHDGFEISADYQYRWTRGRTSLSPSVGVSYKSAKLNDYYWGVHADDLGPGLAPYRAGAGFGWEAGLRANYYATRHLRLALSVNYEKLQHDVAASPLAAENHVFAWFTGLAWTF